MRKFSALVLIAFLFFHNTSFSQSDTNDIIYNLTIGASNPALNILDLSPSNIERPRDPNNFAVLLQNSTENFSIVPKNYSIEFAPLLLYNPINDFKEFKSRSLVDNLRQSFTLSAATTTSKDVDTTQETTRLGVGFKISFLRGDISNQINNAHINKDNLKKRLQNLNSMYYGISSTLLESDSKYASLIKLKAEMKIRIDDWRTKRDNETDPTKKEEYREKMQSVNDSINNVINPQIADVRSEVASDSLLIGKTNLSDDLKSLKDSIKAITEEVSKIEFVRTGVKLDLSGAVAYDFPNQNYGNGELSKIAAWLVFGGDFNVTKKGSSTFLTLLKVLNTPDVNDSVTCGCGQSIFRNSVTNVDLGARYITTWSKFSLSGEIIFRTESNQRPQNKYLVNFGYNLPDNKLVIFSFGKDFEGSPYKTGNLVAALNLLFGLGSERPF